LGETHRFVVSRGRAGIEGEEMLETVDATKATTWSRVALKSAGTGSQIADSENVLVCTEKILTSAPVRL
jgi:hypothetical protein